MARSVILSLLSVFCLAPIAASAGYSDYEDEPPPGDYGRGKFELGVTGGYTWNRGDHNRLGIASNGPGFLVSFGYLPHRWLVAPEIEFATGFTNIDAQEWEYGGYSERAYYVGFTSYQIGGGVKVRNRLLSDKIWPYVGAGAVYLFGSREALTFDSYVMDSFKTRGPGVYAAAGFDLYFLREDFASAVFDFRYLYSPQKIAESDSRAGLDRGFNLTEFRIHIGLRFYFL